MAKKIKSEMDMKNDKDITKIGTNLTVPALVLGGLACVVPLFLYFANFQNGLSARNEDWGSFGSFFSGVASPILTFITMIYLVFSFSGQISESRRLAEIERNNRLDKERQDSISLMLKLIELKNASIEKLNFFFPEDRNPRIDETKGLFYFRHLLWFVIQISEWNGKTKALQEQVKAGVVLPEDELMYSAYLLQKTKNLLLMIREINHIVNMNARIYGIAESIDTKEDMAILTATMSIEEIKISAIVFGKEKGISGIETEKYINNILRYEEAAKEVAKYKDDIETIIKLYDDIYEIRLKRLTAGDKEKEQKE